MVSVQPVAVVIIGPPGSGKGTQSARLGAFLGIPRISTGDILRQVAASNDPLSESVKAIMATGGLVSDEILIGLVTSRLSERDCLNGFILDGFPRNISQAAFLENLLSDKNYKLIVIEINVPEDVILKRIAGRFSCKNCGAIYNKYFVKPRKEGVCDYCGSTEFVYRLDDNEKTIKERLKEYLLQTAPVLDYFKAKSLLVTINGNNPLDIVYNDLISQLQSI
jgi:adenylate kinase